MVNGTSRVVAVATSTQVRGAILGAFAAHNPLCVWEGGTWGVWWEPCLEECGGGERAVGLDREGGGRIQEESEK